MEEKTNKQKTATNWPTNNSSNYDKNTNLIVLVKKILVVIELSSTYYLAKPLSISTKEIWPHKNALHHPMKSGMLEDR